MDLRSMRDSFRPAFVETARKRRERILELLMQPEGAGLRGVASELHCLSGEASMLDFARVADLARVAEHAARAGELATLKRLVDDLDTALRAIEAGGDGR